MRNDKGLDLGALVSILGDAATALEQLANQYHISSDYVLGRQARAAHEELEHRKAFQEVMNRHD